MERRNSSRAASGAGKRPRSSPGRRRAGGFVQILFLVVLALPATAALCAGQSSALPAAGFSAASSLVSDPQPQAAPPSIPRPQVSSHAATPIGPCQLRNAGAAVSAEASVRALAAAGAAPLPSAPSPAHSAAPPVIKPAPCPPLLPVINWYARFLNGPQVKPLTPKEKAWLAVRNVIDPFNILTIVGEAGISVAANSHSPYGPGFIGFEKNTGVSFSQDVTGEFFGTFLIPSIAHQDPHYHRMPNATIPGRILHAIDQVAWTQGDNGRGMINYADLVGFAIDDEISDLYVPGRETNLPSSAERYATGLATAPVDNFITEFLPDVARHIHVRVVLVQRIIDQVARTGSDTGP